jgi:hypothetical protein
LVVDASVVLVELKILLQDWCLAAVDLDEEIFIAYWSWR